MLTTLLCAVFFVLGAAAMFLFDTWSADRYYQRMCKRFPLQAEFMDYLDEHPSQRLWQALANWSGQRIFAMPLDLPVSGIDDALADTWYWTTKDGFTP